MYLTEPHLHTSETSYCGELSGAEMVRRYAAAGYHTVFITDHFSYGFRRDECVLGKSPEEVIERYYAGYRAALEEGRACGVTVLPAAEISVSFAPNHYLAYGENVAAFLTQHPEVTDLQDPAAFFSLAHENGIFIVQAHPFRGNCIPTPIGPDAVEVINTAPQDYDPEAEEKTRRIARENGLLMTSGSDAHHPHDIALGGIGTEKPIRTAADYIEALRRGDAQLFDRHRQ